MLLPKPQSLALMFGLSICSFTGSGQDYLLDSSRIEVSVTSQNADYLEFSPVFYNNGLLFVTTANKSKKNNRIFDIAYTPILADDMLGAATLFEKLNTKYQEGPLAVKSNRQSVFITRSSLEKAKPIVDSLGFNRLSIYEVSLTAKNSKDTILPFNNPKFSCVHPTLSLDEQRLYFSSDRPGGFGGFDIWYSEKEGGKWGEPVNLGKNVNSESNELFPILYQDSILFFSSNRSAMGVSMGLDVYLCRLNIGQTKRLPSPINTNQDDFGLILSPSGKSGYFSSNRAGSDDIYKYELKEPKRPKKIHFGLSFFEKKLLDAGLFQEIPVPDVLVKLVSPDEQLRSTTNSAGAVSFDILPKTKYKVLFSKEQYEPDSLVVVDSQDFMKKIYLKAKEKPCLTYSGRVTAMDGAGLKEVSITITDAVQNLKITTISDTHGDYEFCLSPKVENYTIDATKQGFLPYQVQLTTKQKPSFSLIPVPSNSSKPSFVLENIYYDFNDSKIKESSADELIRLAQILKEYPAINILLVAYTDSRGTKKYNERLARHRARAAKAFLVEQGIDGDRIKPVGRGEVNIRNRCKNGVNCSEEEHQYNRRTEVIFRNKPVEFGAAQKRVTISQY